MTGQWRELENGTKALIVLGLFIKDPISEHILPILFSTLTEGGKASLLAI